MICLVCHKAVVWFDAAKTKLTHASGVKIKYRDHEPVVES